MNKKILRTLTAFCAALMLMGGFSVTAFAQTPEQPAADATNDSGVIYEEPEETAPLTPEGNATLVDDFGGNKQLITVTTKAGNYFYMARNTAKNLRRWMKHRFSRRCWQPSMRLCRGARFWRINWWMRWSRNWLRFPVRA